MPPRVTIREIAAKAGLHFTTVSLALRNSPRLPKETRDRVREIAREMGYRPDPMLAALNAYRVSKGTPHYQATIAWIDNWPERHQLLDIEVFKEYYEGSCERANQLGYKVEEFWLNEPGMTVTKLHRILKTRNIQGMLLAPQPMPGVNPGIDFRDYSAVTFGYSMQPSVLNVVTNHQFHSINLTFERLHELGYRRIGLIATPEWDSKMGNSILASTLLFQWKHPSLTIVGTLLNSSDSLLDPGGLIRRHRLDAVIGWSALAGDLRKLGYSIPRDLGFASLTLSKDETRLSGIYQNDLLIGKKAVDVLVGMLQRGERGVPETPVSTLVEGEWRRGTTLKTMKAISKAAGRKAVGTK